MFFDSDSDGDGDERLNTHHRGSEERERLQRIQMRASRPQTTIKYLRGDLPLQGFPVRARSKHFNQLTDMKRDGEGRCLRDVRPREVRCEHHSC